MSDIPTVDVHPGGDVILICGTEETKRRLRVSSMILQHTSSVFRAMLGPHFSEGNKLASYSSVDIPLPDDDPNAMETVCFVLHMRNDCVPSSLSAQCLVDVVNHCDKYDVFIATRPAINLWLESCMDLRLLSHMEFPTAGRLMEIAFNLELWNHVKRLGIIMVQNAKFDIRSRRKDFPRVPFYIFDQLEQIRIRTSFQMQEVVGDKMDALLCFEDVSGHCTRECDAVNAHKLQFLEHLRDMGLWPWGPGTCRSLLKLRSDVQWESFNDLSEAEKCCTDCVITSMKTAPKVAREMRSAMSRTLDETMSQIFFNHAKEDGMILGFE